MMDNAISWTVTKDNITDIQKRQFAIDKLKELKDSIEKESMSEHQLISDPEVIYKVAVNKILYITERMIMQLDQEKIDLGLDEEDKVKLARNGMLSERN